MSCSPFDLRDYHYQELADPQRRLVESHLKTCAPCREELERLQMTESALFALREEEIPQRIAFVSDPIFEPSPLRRFLTNFWGSTARLGFASATMLSVALVVFALHRPAPAPTVVTTRAPVVAAVTVPPQAAPQADVEALVKTAVAKAIAESEERQVIKTKALVAELQNARQQMLLASLELDQARKRNGSRALLAGNYLPPTETGDLK